MKQQFYGKKPTHKIAKSFKYLGYVINKIIKQNNENSSIYGEREKGKPKYVKFGTTYPY